MAIYILAGASGTSGIAAPTSVPPPVAPAIEVYFSPNGGCTDAVVREISKASKTILVQAYSFTSAPIAAALVQAHKRGIKIDVLLDKSQSSNRYSSADFLANNGIRTFIDSEHAIAHNKVIIVDSEIVITGSFNFTKAAENSNAENLLIIADASLAAKFVANWQNHRSHSDQHFRK